MTPHRRLRAKSPAAQLLAKGAAANFGMQSPQSAMVPSVIALVARVVPEHSVGLVAHLVEVPQSPLEELVSFSGPQAQAAPPLSHEQELPLAHSPTSQRVRPDGLPPASCRARRFEHSHSPHISPRQDPQGMFLQDLERECSQSRSPKHQRFASSHIADAPSMQIVDRDVDLTGELDDMVDAQPVSPTTRSQMHQDDTLVQDVVKNASRWLSGPLPNRTLEANPVEQTPARVRHDAPMPPTSDGSTGAGCGVREQMPEQPAVDDQDLTGLALQLSQQLQVSQSENRALKDRCALLVADNGDLRNQLVINEQQKDELQQCVAETIQQVQDQAESARVALEAQLQRKDAEYDAVKRAAQNALSERNLAKAHVTQLLDVTTNLNEALEAKDDENTKLKVELTNQAAQISNLEVRLSNAEAEIARQVAKNSQLMGSFRQACTLSASPLEQQSSAIPEVQLPPRPSIDVSKSAHFARMQAIRD